MNTTFISRSKFALVAFVATLLVAFGASALAAANAQAVTVSNGAKYVTATMDDSDIQVGSTTYSFRYVPYSHAFIIYVDGHMAGSFQPSIYKNEYWDEGYLKDVDWASSSAYTARIIMLKNKETYLYLKYGNWGDEEFLERPFVDLFKISSAAGHVYAGPVDVGADSMTIKSVSGNTIKVRYTTNERFNTGDYEGGDDISSWYFGLFRTYKSLSYDVSYKYSTTKKDLVASSTSVVPVNSTKWRKVGGDKHYKVTAYKYSSCKTKKFDITPNTYVQVKKVSIKYPGCPAYYVKTKSGKYGWVMGDTYVRVAFHGYCY